MAKFITVNDNEMVNAEHIVGFGLGTEFGNVSLTVSLINETCVTIYDHHSIERFFNELFYHFPPCSQPDTYAEIYRKFLRMAHMTNEGDENE